MSCRIKTKNGEPCPFNASVKNQYTGKSVCRTHDNVCKNTYLKYKSVCEQVWDKKCLETLSVADLKKYIDFATDCKNRRIDFFKECCKGNMDEGHAGAILKMNKIISDCSFQIKKIAPSRPRW